MSGELHAPATLPGKITQVSIEWEGGRVGGSQRLLSRCGEKKKLLSLPAIEPRTVQPVAQSLYRLRYPGSLLNAVRVFIMLCVCVCVCESERETTEQPF